MSRLRPVGVVAFAYATNINKVRILIFYQSKMSLLVTDFTYLKGWDGDIVVKGWHLSTSRVTGSHRMSLRDRAAGRKYRCLTPEWMKQSTTDVIGMMVIYYIQSWKLWYIVRHRLLLQSIASGIRKHNLSAVLLSVQLLISLSYVALRSPTWLCQPSAARLHVTTVLYMFVHCGRTIH